MPAFIDGIPAEERTGKTDARVSDIVLVPAEEMRLSPPAIVAEEIAFAYSSTADSPALIQGISFAVPSGGHLGLHGRSGTGKSTFLLLLLGILRPRSGLLQIDGEDPERYRREVPGRVHYVGPEPFLFAGSVRENLLYGLHRDSKDEELWRHLDQVRLADRIRNLGGLDQQLPESQGIFSSGERQRLALARAFLSSPKLLILDEATAHLDAASEQVVIQELEAVRGRCTLVSVSHRPALLETCDIDLDFNLLRSRQG